LKIALKYGLLITIGVIAWVVIAHLLVPDPRSPVHTFGPLLFFNLLEIVGIYLGIRAKGNESTEQYPFKRDVKAGVSIAIVYVVSTSLFFVVAVGIFGAKLMAAEPGAENQSPWRTALGAFAGLAFAVVLGLIYSTIISFLIAYRQRKSA
jgi:hypothetical protein